MLHSIHVKWTRHGFAINTLAHASTEWKWYQMCKLVKKGVITRHHVSCFFILSQWETPWVSQSITDPHNSASRFTEDNRNGKTRDTDQTWCEKSKKWIHSDAAYDNRSKCMLYHPLVNSTVSRSGLKKAPDVLCKVMSMWNERQNRQRRPNTGDEACFIPGTTQIKEQD